MKFFKNFFKRQHQRLLDVEDGSQTYFIFFRLTQIFSFISALYFWILLRPVSSLLSEIDLSPISYRFQLVFIFSNVLAVLLCEIGLRALDKNKAIGLYIGLIVSFKYLMGWGFPVGLFGLYVFLNKSSQEKFLKNPPQWFVDILTLFKINFTSKPEAPSAQSGD